MAFHFLSTHLLRRGARPALLRQARPRLPQEHPSPSPFSSMCVFDKRFQHYNSPLAKDIDHTSVLGTPETKVTTLSNGLRVASESSMAAETATVGVWIDAGSRFETAETNGTAHFLEHMIFKGTKKRNLRQLEEEIENMGGHLNAYTSREQTTYYAKVLKKDVPVAVDILADILQNSSFEEDRINRERNVILREMEEVGVATHFDYEIFELSCHVWQIRSALQSGTPTLTFGATLGMTLLSSLKTLSRTRELSDGADAVEEVLILKNEFLVVSSVEGQVEEVMFDHLHATAFQYTPLGRTILGPAENIRNITKENLSDYISKHYTGPRMVVAAAGAVNHDELVKTVEKSFQNLSTDPTTAGELVMQEPASFTGSEVRLRDDDCPLAYFAVAVEGAAWIDPDSIALMVMQTMLGSWNKSAGAGKHMGSEMAQQIAANGLAESVMAFNTNYSDSGLFGVYAVAKEENLDDLCYVIMHQIGRFIYRVDPDDVARARNQLKSCLLLHLDGTSPLAEDIGRQLLTYGRRVPLAEFFARIDAVDAECVKRVASRFIYDKSNRSLP